MTASDTKSRLDQALVSRGLVATRARARDVILRGEVTVDGAKASKPAMRVSERERITLAEGAGQYVSRGALKIAAALDHFRFDATDRTAIDIGASTGGFTEVLLARGATRVYAIDNGKGQLHPTLQSDPRVVSLEETDARLLTRAEIPDPVAAIVADVSFISLAKVLPPTFALAAPGCWLAALIKPQFEAEPARVPRSGIIVDPAVHRDACANVTQWLADQPGWHVLGTLPSPIKGGDGNTEFLIGAVRDDG